jgi:transcriptional regulator with XRE-family HTH domain
MKDRITQFLINENISSAEFADKIGVQRSSVSHVLNERNYPSTSFIQKMLTTYGNLNPRWLLLGEGPMLNSPTVVNKEPSLFSHLPNDDFSTAKSTASKEEMTENPVIANPNVSPEKKPEVMSSTFQSMGDLATEVKGITGKTIDSKDVDRIVLFFNDKTFAVYTPSK